MENPDVEKRRAYRRKKARNKHLKVFLIIFFIFTLLVGGVLSVTVLFPIKKVIASGSNLYERVQIEKVSELQNKNIFVIDKEKLEKRLRKSLPYVDSVSIKRKLPDTVELTVKDAKEYAAYTVGKKVFVVSKKGIVLAEYKKVPKGVFEIKAENVKCNIGSKVAFSDDKSKNITETLIKELNNRKIKIDYIDVSDKTNIKIGVLKRFDVLLGSSANLENKLAHLGGMIKGIDPNEDGTINLSMWSNEKSEGTFIKNTKNDEK